MKFKIIPIVMLALFAVQAGAQEPTDLTTQKDKVSYSIGVDVARNFKRLGIDLNTDILVNGLRDEMKGNKLLMTEADLRETMNAFETELRQKQIDATKVAREKNKIEGDAFLAANKTKEGVISLPSGVQYKIIKKGDGKLPTDADTVEYHYRGVLIDGTEFDSSYTRVQPSIFKLSGIIPGLRETLKLMPVGSMWQIFIPPQLAYGERGAGRDIGPNATLIFEIELLAIK
ncbi:MAG: FKBP-type peptidyl-prolyl cis-trans isomerase [Deltaproteobacteria bacterium]|nr:FKBP-type peptidyl-prolyl cis-trans isomerase [Deltaproteobacteria bacterium]